MRCGRRAQLRMLLLDTRFDAAWERLAGHGLCDSAGGSQYRRARAAWRDAGRPAMVNGFLAGWFVADGTPPVTVRRTEGGGDHE